MKPGDRDTLYFEGLRQREFNDTGTYLSAADSHTINDDWYWFIAAGGWKLYLKGGGAEPHGEHDGCPSLSALHGQRVGFELVLGLARHF